MSELFTNDRKTERYIAASATLCVRKAVGGLRASLALVRVSNADRQSTERCAVHPCAPRSRGGERPRHVAGWHADPPGQHLELKKSGFQAVEAPCHPTSRWHAGGHDHPRQAARQFLLLRKVAARRREARALCSAGEHLRSSHKRQSLYVPDAPARTLIRGAAKDAFRGIRLSSSNAIQVTLEKPAALGGRDAESGRQRRGHER
jgi:hypothetical protein